MVNLCEVKEEKNFLKLLFFDYFILGYSSTFLLSLEEICKVLASMSYRHRVFCIVQICIPVNIHDPIAFKNSNIV